MGWDRHYGFQLYQSDPSGNYSGWKATCIGNNSVVCTESGGGVRMAIVNGRPQTTRNNIAVSEYFQCGIIANESTLIFSWSVSRNSNIHDRVFINTTIAHFT